MRGREPVALPTQEHRDTVIGNRVMGKDDQRENERP